MDSKYMALGNSSGGLPSISFSVKRKNETLESHSGFSSKSPHVPAKQPRLTNSKKPSIGYNQHLLPVFNCKQRILREIDGNDTVLIMGETGSGKTTQIPQFLLHAGYARNQMMIVITQPRRVAAITVARRVAQELSSTIGDLVGYTVRFEDVTSEKTKIRFLTDGVLLRESILDRLLLKYSVIMLDEAHERTVNGDLLFGIVKTAQKERKKRKLANLKVIVTSATMDIDHFGRYFNCRGLYLEGRTHPVRVMHVKQPQDDYIHAVLVTLFEIHRNEPIDHDVLIFLTGQDEIEGLAQQIRQLAKINTNGPSDVRVFTLYSQLSQAKQLECFLPVPASTRKIVLATNIAETSITIPGIRCVIDCGYVKEKHFNPSSCFDSLKTVRISKAQAWQRTGRAGRDAPGICYRTYTRKDMETFKTATDPEILRINTTSTVLQLLALGIKCANFDFLDMPSEESLNKANRDLEALGAIRCTGDGMANITPLGRLMVHFPLDPRYSKLLLSAPKFGCLEEMLSLVAVLSSDNIFVVHTEKSELAALAHAKFQSKHGDHLTLLNVFNAFQKTEKPKVWCHDNFLNLRNLTYARNVRNQLADISTNIGLTLSSGAHNVESQKKCLINGLFDNIAVLQKDGNYQTVLGRHKAKIHPSSVLHGKYKPNYILFNELIQTDQNFLRLVTEICVEWIEDVVPHFKNIMKY